MITNLLIYLIPPKTEGVAVVTLVQSILKNVEDREKEPTKNGIENGEKNEPRDCFSRLDWNLTEEINSAIAIAAQNMNK